MRGSLNNKKGFSIFDYTKRVFKKLSIMPQKSLSHDVKEVDVKEGVAVAYANVYDFEDSDGDISLHGSFEKAVKDGFKRIRVLKDHDRYTSIGVPTKIDTQDSYGLLTETQFNLKKGVALDVLSDIALAKEYGMNAELSIGYGRVVRDPANKKAIKEYGWLGEYSFLSSWAANEKSTVLSLKALGEVESMDDIVSFLAKMYDLPHTDTRLKEVESILTLIEKSKKELDDQIKGENMDVYKILHKALYLY